MPLNERSYSLFRLAKCPDRCCAVPEGSDLPEALNRNEWAPAEVLNAGERRPPGFNNEVAVFACAVQGFYIFRWSGKKSPYSAPT